MLTSKERKQVFEKYVKERAEEERREKRNKMKERKEQFQKLLEEAGLHGKYVWMILTRARARAHFTDTWCAMSSRKLDLNN